ncbi:MAG TPA: prepilin-type N-terminal cleavage/methylation domain-containing protein, partial [Actinomycetota bacterium]|nr:prepilin-type N-terminal cleavage/methylation domain-containing protein [Actinomycetota bacterium]
MHTRKREDGFTMVETMVAIAIFGVVGIAMAGLMSSGMKGLLHSRQRTVSVADANEVLETARALSFSNVGLDPSDPTLATDPAITTSGGARFYNAQPLQYAASVSGHPFTPHCQTGIQRGPSTLTRWIYVTGAGTPTNGVYPLRQVTVVIAWARPGLQGGTLWAPQAGQECGTPPPANARNSLTSSTVIAPNSPGTP